MRLLKRKPKFIWHAVRIVPPTIRPGQSESLGGKLLRGGK